MEGRSNEGESELEWEERVLFRDRRSEWCAPGGDEYGRELRSPCDEESARCGRGDKLEDDACERDL